MAEWIWAFGGGSLIGFAGLLLLWANGRVLGVSGIVGGIFQADRADKKWRGLFVCGIFSGGLLLRFILPSAFAFTLSRSNFALIAAGLLVGLGTRLSGGCTSGHGICGISRLSPRSLTATIAFMAAGALVVFAISHFFGGRV